MLGNLYSVTGATQKSNSAYIKSIKLFDELKDSRMALRAFHNLYVPNNFENIDQARIQFFEKQLDHAKEIGDSALEVNILGTLGDIYIYQDDLEKAMENYSKALRIGRQNKFHEGICSSLLGLTEIYISMDYLPHARKTCAGAWNITKRLEIYEANLLHLRPWDGFRNYLEI